MAGQVRLRRLLAACLAAVCGVATAVVSTPGAGADPRPPPPGNPVAYVNYYRATAGLPPVSENAALAEAARKHAVYMVKNDVIGHTEDVGNPWYTPEGATAAQRSNVFTHSSAGAPDEVAVDGWMTGPFHAVGILDPTLRETGYGSFREQGGSVSMGAALDVLSSRGPIPAGVSYPVMWPGNGMSVPVSAFETESPDPLTSCTGYTRPAGLPVILQLGPAANAGITNVGTSFAANGVALEHCEFDGNNYRNPGADDQALGRAILASHGAIVIVPRAPLRPRTRYDVSVTVAGATHTWSFGVLSLWNGPRPPVTAGVVPSSPDAAAVRGNARVDVFVRGTDNALYWASWNGAAWSTWTGLGGPAGGIVGDPAAVSWAPGRLDVFARAPDNRLWQTFSTDGGASWSGWIKTFGDDGVLASAPEVSTRGEGRLDLFVRGTDNLVYQRFYDGDWNAGWIGHGAPPSGATADPASASWDGTRVDLFARGANERLWQRTWNGSQWSAWTQPPGSGATPLASSPEATSSGPNHLAVFARASDNSLMELQHESGWALWQPVGRSTDVIQEGVGATSRGPGRIDVFVRGTDNLAYQFWL
jgi:hypothetical protein